jgi:hypothetical protein
MKHVLGDFNSLDERGFVFVRLARVPITVGEGEVVQLRDDEGNSAICTVVDVDPVRGLAYLDPELTTFEHGALDAMPLYPTADSFTSYVVVTAQTVLERLTTGAPMSRSLSKVGA